MALRSAYSPTLNGDPTVLLWGDAAGLNARLAIFCAKC
jgi:hypothetical protein